MFVVFLLNLSFYHDSVVVLLISRACVWARLSVSNVRMYKGIHITTQEMT